MRHIRAQYYGMISEIDFQLGRVVEAIEARGEWQDTLVVITSDHGSNWVITVSSKSWVSFPELSRAGTLA